MPDVSRRSSRSSTPLSTAGETVDVESELPAKQRHDVASVPSTSEKEVSTDSEKGKEVVLIDWDGPDDPANPRAWTPARQWVATIVVSLFTLLAPLTSTITAPATEPIAAELGIEVSRTAISREVWLNARTGRRDPEAIAHFNHGSRFCRRSSLLWSAQRALWAARHPADQQYPLRHIVRLLFALKT